MLPTAHRLLVAYHKTEEIKVLIMPWYCVSHGSFSLVQFILGTDNETIKILHLDGPIYDLRTDGVGFL